MAEESGAHQYHWNTDNYYRRPHVRLRVIASLIKSLAAGGRARSVLDVGCGQAALANLLGEHFEYYGCDGYREGFELKTKRAECVNWVYSESAPQLPFEAKQFDFIVCSGFLEYLQRRSEFLALASRRLTSGGVLLTSLINFQRWDRSLARMGMNLGLPRPRSIHPAWRSPISLQHAFELFNQTGLPLQGGIIIPYRINGMKTQQLHCLSPETLATRWMGLQRWTDSQCLFIASEQALPLSLTYEA